MDLVEYQKNDLSKRRSKVQQCFINKHSTLIGMQEILFVTNKSYEGQDNKTRMA